MTRHPVPQSAAELIRLATEQNLSLAVAESLTGGWLASRLVGVPGASAVFRGGIVSYQTEVKRDVLGVDADVLAELGPVDPLVAQLMAERVRAQFTVNGTPADIGIATTGVAGPMPQAGHPVGEVYISVATAGATRVEQVRLHGSRDEIRSQTVAAALQLALEIVREL